MSKRASFPGRATYTFCPLAEGAKRVCGAAQGRGAFLTYTFCPLAKGAKRVCGTAQLGEACVTYTFWGGSRGGENVSVQSILEPILRQYRDARPLSHNPALVSGEGGEAF